MPNPNNNSVQDKFITLENLERYNGYVYPDEMSWDEYQEIEPEAGKTYFIYDYDAGQSAEAVDVTYDNTSSELQANDVQDAIDELKDLIDQGGSTDTTYTLSVGTGADADKIVLTPSSGNPDKITVPYATNAGDASTVNGNTVPVDFKGTTQQWNALTTAQKKEYDRAFITDDYDLPDHMAAYEITYNNTSTGLSSTNVQDAIGEVNGKVVTTDATTSAHGLMSAADKTKVNGLGTAAYLDLSNTYSSSGTVPVSGTAVASALIQSGAMHYKGYVDLTNHLLPIDGSAKVGDFYYANVDGRYQVSENHYYDADIYDIFVCTQSTSSTSTWNCIPTGVKSSRAGSRLFIGTTTEWNEQSTNDKKYYDVAMFTND